MQLIFVVETNEKAKTDEKYIRVLINNAYKISNEQISYLYLGGKGSYHSENIKIQLRERIERYKTSAVPETKIIYFIDADSFKPAWQKMNEEIIKYCTKNKYDLVWFNKDIEEVFLGKKIKNNKKADQARKFLRNGKIEDMELLHEPNPLEKSRSSNILCVLDIYLPRKK